MAGDARGGFAFVDAVGMAAATRRCPVCADEWELRGVVIERGRAPAARRVARGARGAESCCGVRGILRGVVVALMARGAHGRFSLEHAIAMTRGADRGFVTAGERELGGVVIEGAAAPCGDAVAGGADARESKLRMRRHLRVREACLVTGHTGGVLAFVHTVAVARDAQRGFMRAGQRELGGVMIETARRPRRGGVTTGAGGGEAGRAVWRILGGGEVGLMAARALFGFAAVHRIAVARRAGGGFVGASQRELREGVVKGAAHPRGGGVARCARRRESERRVWRARGSVEVLLVARLAGCRLAFEDVVPVAARA